MRFSRRTTYAVLLTLATLWTAPLLAEEPKLGRVDFPVSASPEAQQHFIRGVLYLHSFEYSDAREAFRKAQEIEPNFAMAYWGEAMTYNQPIWLKESPESAREVLGRLGATPEERLAKAPTEREKDYLRAVSYLSAEGDLESRNSAYAEAMRRLEEKYPDDLEAKAFHALALLGTCYEGREVPIYMRAAALAEEVFAANPEHPGAAHYLIHAYDDPVHAPLGLRAARAYSKIAPAAEHALHMPSHIFLALGMWDETIASNEESWAAKEEYMARVGEEKGERNLHALWWLQYAFLQQGRYEEARKLLGIVEEDFREVKSRKFRTHLSQMRSGFILETDRWDLVPEEIDIDFSRLSLAVFTTELSLRGFAAVHAGRLDRAEELLQEMRTRREEVVESIRHESGETPGSETYQRIGTESTREALVMELELEAQIRLAQNKTDEALKLLDEAVQVEKEAPFAFGPPIPNKPAFELYGEVLLKLDRPQEARRQFETALSRTPGRARALFGLAAATARTGDRQVYENTLARIRENWSKADPGLLAKMEQEVLGTAKDAEGMGTR